MFINYGTMETKFKRRRMSKNNPQLQASNTVWNRNIESPASMRLLCVRCRYSPRKRFFCSEIIECAEDAGIVVYTCAWNTFFYSMNKRLL